MLTTNSTAHMIAPHETDISTISKQFYTNSNIEPERTVLSDVNKRAGKKCIVTIFQTEMKNTTINLFKFHSYTVINEYLTPSCAKKRWMEIVMTARFLYIHV